MEDPSQADVSLCLKYTCAIRSARESKGYTVIDTRTWSKTAGRGETAEVRPTAALLSQQQYTADRGGVYTCDNIQGPHAAPCPWRAMSWLSRPKPQSTSRRCPKLLASHRRSPLARTPLATSHCGCAATSLSLHGRSVWSGPCGWGRLDGTALPTHMSQNKGSTFVMLRTHWRSA